MVRSETERLFYHGFDNYMKYAYPEDELKPVSCKPLTRDWANPAHIELNDPLGNYSLTLVDSLSTLAILASGSGPEKSRRKALKHFKDGVIDLVRLYGDGSDGPKGYGVRGRGFDMDSKVQVFETVIRGVGGLLSAHLFATGDLPLDGYFPHEGGKLDAEGNLHIKWSRKFTYNGQLLRLAHDLAKRLLPAFTTSTGLPYPRVNLRYGIPFYLNSPLSCNNEDGPCDAECPVVPPGNRELTETCSAGAASLVLEFTVLSRLTGNFDFENVAKRAFWSVWQRRSSIGLIGNGIDAETGHWTGPYTGLGAGVDSFFEYAVKSHILLSGTNVTEEQLTYSDNWFAKFDIPLLDRQDHDPDSFLKVWKEAHAAVKRHLYRGHNHVHPHYIQGDLLTGAIRAFWMDSLSAFYPGLLALTGDVEEGIESHLLFTALWNRYAAMPERWSPHTGTIEGGLNWWGGRPEFIESTYHLYRATQDPFYLHVGEMTLQDIKRRSWAKCGLSGLQDVRTGEHNDRMESFFLGETAKYLFLLFDEDHPLNKLDAPYVFTTEGHPLLIPKSSRHNTPHRRLNPAVHEEKTGAIQDTCPVPRRSLAFSISNVANRKDLFHAAHLARLNLEPTIDPLELHLINRMEGHTSSTLTDLISPTNYTYYPWTLPIDLIPSHGICSAFDPPTTIDVTFPAGSNLMWPASSLSRVHNGYLINGMGGLKLGMVQDVSDLGAHGPANDLFRVQTINNMALGRDEVVLIAKDTISGVLSPSDPNFTRIRDEVYLEIAVDFPKVNITSAARDEDSATPAVSAADPNAVMAIPEPIEDDVGSALQNVLRFLMPQSGQKKEQPPPPKPSVVRRYFTAITPTGPGFAPLQDATEFLRPDSQGNSQGNLAWRNVYVGGQNCEGVLAVDIPRHNQVIVLQRGGCSFSEKLQNIPSFPPSSASLQLVVVVSYEPEDDQLGIVHTRPHLDIDQYTPGGLPRRNPIPMVLVGGGGDTYRAMQQATALGVKRRYSMRAQGVLISNMIVL
jgi:hypothetical protein